MFEFLVKEFGSKGAMLFLCGFGLFIVFGLEFVLLVWFFVTGFHFFPKRLSNATTL